MNQFVILSFGVDPLNWPSFIEIGEIACSTPAWCTHGLTLNLSENLTVSFIVYLIPVFDGHFAEKLFNLFSVVNKKKIGVGVVGMTSALQGYIISCRSHASSLPLRSKPKMVCLCYNCVVTQGCHSNSSEVKMAASSKLTSRSS